MMELELRVKTAELLKAVRLERGLSQERLARISGIDRTFISGVERCSRNITLDTLEKLLLALEIDRFAFLTRLATLLHQTNKPMNERVL